MTLFQYMYIWMCSRFIFFSSPFSIFEANGDVSFNILDARDHDISNAIISKSSPISTSVESESGKLKQDIFVSQPKIPDKIQGISQSSRRKTK